MSNTHTAEPGMLSTGNKRRRKTVTGRTALAVVCENIACISVPVGWSGKEAQDDVSPVHVDDVACCVQEVEVKVRISRHGAVEPRLQKCGPLLLEDALRASQVCFTHTSYTGHHHLEQKKRNLIQWRQRNRTRGRERKHLLQMMKLHGHLSEEEINMWPPLHGAHKVGL